MDFDKNFVEISSFWTFLLDLVPNFYSGSSSEVLFDLGPTWGEVATCKLFASCRTMSGPRACLWNENTEHLQRKSETFDQQNMEY